MEKEVVVHRLAASHSACKSLNRLRISRISTSHRLDSSTRAAASARKCDTACSIAAEFFLIASPELSWSLSRVTVISRMCSCV